MFQKYILCITRAIGEILFLNVLGDMLDQSFDKDASKLVKCSVCVIFPDEFFAFLILYV